MISWIIKWNDCLEVETSSRLCVPWIIAYSILFSWNFLTFSTLLISLTFLLPSLFLSLIMPQVRLMTTQRNFLYAEVNKQTHRLFLIFLYRLFRGKSWCKFARIKAKQFPVTKLYKAIDTATWIQFHFQKRFSSCWVCHVEFVEIGIITTYSSALITDVTFIVRPYHRCDNFMSKIAVKLSEQVAVNQESFTPGCCSIRTTMMRRPWICKTFCVLYHKAL